MSPGAKYLCGWLISAFIKLRGVKPELQSKIHDSGVTYGQSKKGTHRKRCAWYVIIRVV
jgi:hypothetical protein